MEITEDNYTKFKHIMPVQRGNCKIDNVATLNALLFIAENGCKWRALPKEFGNWRTLYTSITRWAKSGILERIFNELKVNGIIEIMYLDSTIVKAHPHETDALKKTGKHSLGKSRGGLATKIHVLATNERTAFAISLSGGESHNSPAGEELLITVGEQLTLTDLAMDKAYSGTNMRIIAETLNFNPIIPPKSNSTGSWQYDTEKYKLRNKIERLFERIKRRFCKVFTR